MDNYYYSFNAYLRKRFGQRAHRISLNAGFDCPNTDESKGKTGCIFCNQKSFAYFTDTYPPIEAQIRDSIAPVKKRFKAKKFIAYFQNSTNTYASLAELKEAYDTIKLFPEIVGLAISTRPDCIDREKLDLIESYAKDYEVWIEYGVQSIHEASLKKIKRAHTFKESLKAIEDTAGRNIKIGAHIILGLPGESRDLIIQTAKMVASLPISGTKLHTFHVLRDTESEKLFKSGRIELLEEDQYVSLACDFLEHLNPECVILRIISDAKPHILIAPEWMNRKHQVAGQIGKEFKRRGTRQGSRYEKKSLCIR